MTETHTAATGVAGRHSEHRVLFYDHDEEVVAAVSEFVAGGLHADEIVVLICTAGHQAGVEARLANPGASPFDVHRRGRLVTLDAGETLDSISVDGTPDPVAFERVVGRLIAHLAADGRPVRAFGEMVALLWADGHVGAAIELEMLWGGLAERVPFELMCAYPATTLVDADAVTAVNRVCELHTAVQPRAGEPAESLGLRAYPPAPESVTHARHHLAGVLGGIGDRDAIDVALLVVSELASNAVRHAGTEFVVEATRQADTLRIAVRDRDNRPPRETVATADADGGRGLALIAALSRRWGVAQREVGKVVWSEITLT